jgi:hypothetical protein
MAQQPRAIQGIVAEQGTNQPIADAEVALYGQTGGAVRLNGGWRTDASIRVRTDYRGAFSLTPETSGEYRVEATKDGFLAADGGSPNFAEVRLTSDKASAQVRLYLARSARLTGRAINEDNRPIPGLQLAVVRPIMGRRIWANVTSVKTDAAGAFTVSKLAPGEYAVRVGAVAVEQQLHTQFTTEDAAAITSQYERSIWPGGGGSERALPVSLPSGGTVDIGVIRARKVPHYGVRVRVPEGSCTTGDNVRIGLSERMGETAAQHPLGEMACSREVLITGFASGSYRLILSVDGKPRETRGTASVPFEVVDKNLQIDAPLAVGVTVEGSIVATEGSKAPDLSKVKLSLTGMDYVGFGDEEGMVRPDEQGKFRFTYVRRVEQALSVSGISPTHYVKEVRYNATPLRGDIITLDEGAGRHTLTIVTDGNPAAIFGSVVSDDQPVSKAMVIARKWPVEMGRISSGMFGARSDESGRFQVGGLPPGEYRVIAVRPLSPDIPNSKIENALAAGTKVQVGENGVEHVKLQLTELR